jgi:hypothetical protein
MNVGRVPVSLDGGGLRLDGDRAVAVAPLLRQLCRDAAAFAS